MDEHFAQAQNPLAEAVPLLDDDLQYAACCIANEPKSMQKFRKQAVSGCVEGAQVGRSDLPSPAISTRHHPESDSPEGYRIGGSSHHPDIMA